MFLSDNVMNESLKLLKINCLEKLIFFFNFPSRSHCTCTELMARLGTRRILDVEEINMNQV